jgi:hypothetical protein
LHWFTLDVGAGYPRQSSIVAILGGSDSVAKAKVSAEMPEAGNEKVFTEENCFEVRDIQRHSFAKTGMNLLIRPQKNEKQRLEMVNR